MLLGGQQAEWRVLPEHLHAPTSHSSEESGTKVSGRVQWVSTVHAHGHADAQDDQANGQRLHSFRSSNIPVIGYGQDTQHQHACSNHLQQEGTLII